MTASYVEESAMPNRWVVILDPRLAWIGGVVCFVTAVTFYVEASVKGWPTAAMGLFFGIVAGGVAQLLLTTVLVPVALFFVAGKSWLRWGAWMASASAAAAGLLLVMHIIPAEYEALMYGLAVLLAPLSMYAAYRDYARYYGLNSLHKNAAPPTNTKLVKQ